VPIRAIRGKNKENLMSQYQIYPEDYTPVLSVKRTEIAIKEIKQYFQQALAWSLNLRRVTAPLFVKAGTGINDDLNGVERPVSFDIKAMNGAKAEIVQSLAKWKRLMLADLEIESGEGIYTDMNAIRPDETLDNLHSLYVDQWDWERVMEEEQRNLGFLKKMVEHIFDAMKKTEQFIHDRYPEISPVLPARITFFHAEELLGRYPGLTPKQREDAVCEEFGAVFVIGIGAELRDGVPHDFRAPDYDDWTTPTGGGKGLNGDILLWNPVLKRAFEISSMGIRVDKEVLLRQLALTGTLQRRELYFHQRLLRDELPLSIGGGIGQSRLCIYFLRKAHIGEVQASIWPDPAFAPFPVPACPLIFLM
jgi:aspartate--ammonia ligase